MKRTAKLATCVVFLSLGLGVLLKGYRSDRVGKWTATSNLKTARTGACSALLPDGRVLITGGEGPYGALASAEVYDASGASSEAAPMAFAHSDHACVALDGGRVLVAGGKTSGDGATNMAEVYDPASRAWTVIGPMTTPRSGATASVLKNDLVLIAGGEAYGQALASLEFFNPYLNTFTPLAVFMSSPRKDHAAAVLSDGRVLLIGGHDGKTALDSVDVYNPSTGLVSSAASLSSPRAALSATTLLDGKVLVAGGSNRSTDLGSAELYDPNTGAFSATGSMLAARRGHKAFLIPDNNTVLIVGGTSGGTALAAAEQFVPWEGVFKPFDPLSEARGGLTGALLNKGTLLVAGGLGKRGALSSVEALVVATISTNKYDYIPGETVTITGSGWQAGETVNILFHEDPLVHPDWTQSAVADASGNITSSYLVEPHDFGVTFYLTATGVSSGRVAQTSFHDGGYDDDQCANGGVGKPPTPCDWVNGNLNGSKAHYVEGDSVSYRLKVVVDGVTVPVPTDLAVTIEWDTLKGGKHALDYITDWDRTNTVAGGSDPCLGVAGCTTPPGAPMSTFPIPIDGTGTSGMLPGHSQIGGQSFKLYGGAAVASITGVSCPSVCSALSPYYSVNGSDASTSITINIHVTSAGTVVLAWGGHIGTRLDWGATNSAVTISGSPFHTRIAGCVNCGTGNGSQDRSLSADAVVFPGRITVVKQANPEGPTPFPFTASPALPGPVTSFSLVDDGTPSNTQVFPGVTDFTDYTITETPLPSGWVRDSISCVDDDTQSTVATGNTSTGAVTFGLAEGQNVTCTYTNSRPPKLTVNKVLAPSSDPGKFNLQIDGATAGTGANVGDGGTTGPVTTTAGSHTVGEAAGTATSLSNYDTVIGGDCAADGSITLATGDNKVCTITNTRKPRLTVTKILVPSGDSGKFNLQIDGATAGTGADVGNGGTTGPQNVSIGSHTVGETAGTGTSLSNYTSVIGGDCAADGTITLAAGDNKTCTITNTKAAKLTVNKVLAPSSDPGKFNLQIDGATAGTGADVGNGGTTGPQTVTVGSHNVGETAGTGTSLSDYTAVIGGDCAADGSVTVAAGDNKTCTITNTRKPRLTVTKTLVPSNDPGLFNLQIDGSTAGSGANVGNGGTTGAVTSSIGSHTVGEAAGTGTNLSDYDSVIGGDCAANGSITLAAGDNKTCTITNTRKPRLTVTKTLVPSNDPGLFNLQIDGSTAGTGANVGNGGSTGAVNVTAGAHTVGETAGNSTSLSDYTTVIGGDCAANGSVTLAAGDNKTCTITNTRKPRLTVTKILAPDSDPGKFNLQIDGATAGTGANVGNGGTTGAQNVSIGSHTVGETAGTGTSLSDYTAVIGGDCAGNGSVTLAAGDSKVCTITNTRKPKLTVNKVLAPSGDAGKFNLQIDGVTAGTGANVGNGGTTGAQNVSVGSHTVGETAGTSTSLSNYTAVIGGDCAADGSVTLAPGDNKTCIITNSRKPKLTVTKTLVPSSDTGKFNLQIDGVTAGTGTNVGNGGTTGAVSVSIGGHTVGETAGTGTDLANYTAVFGGACDANGNVTLAAGDNKTCTITNTRAATLTVKKVTNPTIDTGKFNLQIDAATAGTGADVGNGGTTGAVKVGVGSHTVGETAGTGTNLADYSAVIGGDCASNGSVTVSAGQNKVCTITNTRIPILTVNKVLLPSNDTGLFNLRIDGVTAGTGGNVGDGGTTGARQVTVGSHTVSETAGTNTNLADYVSAIGGACAANGSVTMNAGDVKTCTITNTKKGMAQVTKTVGSLSPGAPPGIPPTGTQSFTFQIRQGASTTQAGNVLEQGVADSTNGGVVTFNTKLIPGQTYQFCEVVMPGWFTTLGPPLYVVFNPTGDNSTVCADFTVNPGETKNFAIENEPPPSPRGMGRTIGFWKNWSSCSGGNQAPVLDQTLASFPIASGKTTHGVYVGKLYVDTCSKAVSILNKSNLKGDKMSNDPAFNMAAQLLGAMLNVQVGAGICPNYLTALQEGQTLLYNHSFNGSTYTAFSAAEATVANTLATYLDNYNNNKPCPASPPPLLP